MIQVYLDAIGLVAPGLENWHNSQDILNGKTGYQAKQMPRLMPDFLPATERRRSSSSARLAVQVAQEALQTSKQDAGTLATVFASTDGDTEIINNLCINLALEEKVISPTRFHNSVYNAPAGYWHIAASSPSSSNSICAGDQSFAVGIMDAAVQSVTEQRSVMLCAYDIAVPEPLYNVRPVDIPFATAMLLSIKKSPKSLAKLVFTLEITDQPASKVGIEELDEMMQHNFIARALPLLACLSARSEGQICMEYTGSQMLYIDVEHL